MVTLRDIEAARARIRDAIYLSPCARSEHFSRLLGAEVYFKLENLQMTGSFKERGALNKLLQLSPEERARGVIAASAGNHAQAVAWQASRLGIRATIVMPEATPLIKAGSTRDYGAQVILHGGSFDDALAEAKRLCAERNLVFVHPFDDEAIVAGQGTLGLELLEQCPHVELVLVPTGGAGLVSGTALAIKEQRPGVRVVGVECAAVPKLRASLEAGGPVLVPRATTLADGIAVRKPGAVTYELFRRWVDDVVSVDEEEIAHAVLQLIEREKTVAEGAGAVALAAALHGRVDVRGKRVVLVVSGGNIDVNLLSRIIERGLAKDGRLARLAVTGADRPGLLAGITGVVAAGDANVVEIHHERAFLRSAPGTTEIELVLETRGRAHAEELVRALRDAGYAVSER